MKSDLKNLGQIIARSCCWKVQIFSHASLRRSNTNLNIVNRSKTLVDEHSHTGHFRLDCTRAVHYLYPSNSVAVPWKHLIIVPADIKKLTVYRQCQGERERNVQHCRFTCSVESRLAQTFRFNWRAYIKFCCLALASVKREPVPLMPSADRQAITSGTHR